MQGHQERDSIQDRSLRDGSGVFVIDTKRQATGLRSRTAGARWEQIITAASEYYRIEGSAVIEKTPEPMRVISRAGNGRFLAYYEKKAQPDYKGALRNGRCIVFEAKHTDGTQIKQSVVTEAQAAQLDRYRSVGACTCVLVSFQFKRFFMVPWAVFRNMKGEFGRRYARPDDLKPWEIKFKGGALRYLEKAELL